MSLYAMMRTSASGMAAQANRLGTVADNVANSSTTGYKRASVEFSSMILEQATSDYTSGGVTPNVRYAISEQGNLAYTSSTTDLALSGEGFFLVQGSDSQVYMTRAGSFVLNSDGELVNAAGFKLMGVPNGGAFVSNSTAGLEPVSIGNLGLVATPSSSGTLNVNLNSNATVVTAGAEPSTNLATSEYTSRSSLVTFDNLGNEVMVDIYFAKTAADTWQVTAFERAPGAGPGFPYAAAAMDNQTFVFDPTTGRFATGSPDSLTFTITNGSAITLDMSESSQFAANYKVLDATMNGNAASEVDRIAVSKEGIVSAIYKNGSQVEAFRIPLGTVTSVDMLRPLPGNVYSVTNDSGNLQVNLAGQSGLGSITSGALEQSTVDLASELTTMIESQNSYTANSKVFQTGAELMDVLVNLRR